MPDARRAAFPALVVVLVGCHSAAAPGWQADASVLVSSNDAAPAIVASPGWDPGPFKTPCPEDASDGAEVCPSPPAMCADTSRLVIYQNGRCVSGWCAWQKQEADCAGVGGTCWDGGSVAEGGGDGEAVVVGLSADASSGCLLYAPPGPDLPKVACDVDASNDAGPCPLPPSVCADSQWLVYYDNGQCASGWCTWQKLHRDCGVGLCARGGCVPPPFSGTLPAAN